MIEVRIRHEDVAKAVYLCDWPTEALDTLIPTIGGWGIYIGGCTYLADALSGQIIVDSSGAWMEVVVADDD